MKFKRFIIMGIFLLNICMFSLFFIACSPGDKKADNSNQDNSSLIGSISDGSPDLDSTVGSSQAVSGTVETADSGIVSSKSNNASSSQSKAVSSSSISSTGTSSKKADGGKTDSKPQESEETVSNFDDGYDETLDGEWAD